MMATSKPLVTVLTPVYNGEAYIARCIESVLQQTYDRWNYVIVDNASTDGTGDNLAKYAAGDPRITVHRNNRLVPVIANYNIALRRIGPDTAWCKFLSADDELFPECLGRMVALAEANPTVGLVTAHQLRGTHVGLHGMRYPEAVASGRTVARQSLLGTVSMLSNPTSHMIRADLVRSRDSLLRRVEPARRRSLLLRHPPVVRSRLRPSGADVRAGPRADAHVVGGAAPEHVPARPPEDAEDLWPHLPDVRRVRASLRSAHGRLLRVPGARPVHARRPRHLGLHRDGLRGLGLPVSRGRVLRSTLRQALRVALCPHTQVPKLVRLMRPRRDDEASWRLWWAPTGFEAVRPRTTHRK
jgi:Glycosyl transferase family 2